jgi:hypothetical protein
MHHIHSVNPGMVKSRGNVSTLMLHSFLHIQDEGAQDGYGDAVKSACIEFFKHVRDESNLILFTSDHIWKKETPILYCEAWKLVRRSVLIKNLPPPPPSPSLILYLKDGSIPDL